MSNEVEAPTTEQPAEKPYSLIASEMFGSDYHGEVPVEEEAPPIEASDDDPVEEPVEEIIEEVSEEVTEETDIEEDAAPQAEPEYQEYELGHVAQLLGVDEDQLDLNDEGQVVLNGKVNGAPVKAPAAELLASFQTQEAADQRLAEAKEKASTITQGLAEKSQQVNAQFQAASALVQSAESLLSEDSNAVNWERLRNEDPAEYAAKKRDFDDRAARIQKVKNDALNAYQSVEGFQQQEFAQTHAEHLQRESELLIEAVPEWKDEKVATEEKAQLGKYLLSNGFTQEDVAGASDHRLITAMRKAMLYDANQKSSNVAAKKVARIPKVVKPGTPKSPNQTKQQNLERLRQRMIQTGSVDDAHAYNQAKRNM